jgi:TolA-binding protein
VAWCAVAIVYGLAAVGRGQSVADGEPAKGTAPGERRQVPGPLNFANALLNERRYELATEEFEKFLQTGPAPANAAEAHYGLARAQIFLGKYLEARTHLEAFLKLAPESRQVPTARFRLAEAAYLSRDLPEAKRGFEEYLAAYPGHMHRDAAWPYLGDVRFRLGDMAGARAAYEKAIAEFPDGPLTDRARFYLARVLASEKETDAALGLLRALAGRAGSDWADRARVQIPQVLIGAGRFDAALGEIAALERAGRAGAAPGELALHRAEALAGLKRAVEAEAVLRGLLDREGVPGPVAAQAGYALGQLAWDQEKFPAALAAWEAAQAKGPSPALEPMLLFRSAEALGRTGQHDLARARFLTLADKYPNDAWTDQALVQAGRLALEAGDPAAACAAADRLLKHFPRSPLRSDARLIAARGAQLGGKLGEAIAGFRQLLADDSPPSPETTQAALYYLSQAYKAAGQHEKAAEVLAELAKKPGMSLAGQAQYVLGQGHFEGGRFAEAIAALDPFVRQNPKDPLTPHALAYLVLAHDALGQQREVEGRLGDLVRGWPESEDVLRVRLRLGEQALEAREFRRAEELLEPAAADRAAAAAKGAGPAEPWTVRARIGLGWALLGEEKPAEAAEAFGRALTARPPAPPELAAEAAYMEGWALEKAGQVDRALAAYTRAADAYADRPQGPASALARAQLLARSGRSGDAADALAGLLEKHPNGLDERTPAAVLLAELARAQEQAGRAGDSRATYQRLLNEAPRGAAAAEARLALGEEAAKQQRYDEARALLEAIANPREADRVDATIRDRARFRLGRLALDQGQNDEAAGQFRRLIEDSEPTPARDLSRFWHAEALYRGDHPSEAEPEFAALVRERPADAASETWRDTARLRKIQCLVSLRRWSEALGESDAFLAERPEFPQRAEIHIARGRALQSQALPQFAQARTAFETAIAAAPGSEAAARAQLFIGETWLHEKNYHEAVRAFHQVELLYKLPRLQADALLEAGTCYDALGRPDQAAEAYRKVVDKFADQPAAAEARRRLAALAAANGSTAPR